MKAKVPKGRLPLGQRILWLASSAVWMWVSVRLDHRSWCSTVHRCFTNGNAQVNAMDAPERPAGVAGWESRAVIAGDTSCHRRKIGLDYALRSLLRRCTPV